ncbi:MAG: hypothetical protein ACREGI_01915, partial [Candidatus Levyibacteriota bacterium]
TLALLPPDQQEKYLELIMKGLTPDELLKEQDKLLVKKLSSTDDQEEIDPYLQASQKADEERNAQEQAEREDEAIEVRRKAIQQRRDEMKPEDRKKFDDWLEDPAHPERKTRYEERSTWTTEQRREGQRQNFKEYLLQMQRGEVPIPKRYNPQTKTLEEYGSFDEYLRTVLPRLQAWQQKQVEEIQIRKISFLKPRTIFRTKDRVNQQNTRENSIPNVIQLGGQRQRFWRLRRIFIPVRMQTTMVSNSVPVGGETQESSYTTGGQNLPHRRKGLVGKAWKGFRTFKNIQTVAKVARTIWQFIGGLGPIINGVFIFLIAFGIIEIILAGGNASPQSQTQAQPQTPSVSLLAQFSEGFVIEFAATKTCSHYAHSYPEAPDGWTYVDHTDKGCVNDVQPSFSPQVRQILQNSISGASLLDSVGFVKAVAKASEKPFVDKSGNEIPGSADDFLQSDHTPNGYQLIQNADQNWKNIQQGDVLIYNSTDNTHMSIVTQILGQNKNGVSLLQVAESDGGYCGSARGCVDLASESADNPDIKGWLRLL